MNNNYLFFLFLFLHPFSGSTQYDTLHYIPPVYVSDAIKNTNHSCRDHFLILSTNETNTFQVLVERGDGTNLTAYTILAGSEISPGLFNLSRNNPLKIQFNGTGVGVENIFTDVSLNTALPVGGYKLVADKPFFVNIRHLANSQGASLTSKGTTAFGNSFLAGFQAAGSAASTTVTDEMSNFIAVMAISDNTNIEIDNFRSGVTFIGQPSSGAPATANIINFSLNKGESYIIAQTRDNMTGDMNDYNGIRITSNKDIVVNSGSWTGPSRNNGSRDIGIDQMIPSKYAGKKYGITSGKSNVIGANEVEKVIVISTKSGSTTVTSGAGGSVTLTGQGDYAILTGVSHWSAASPVYPTTEAHYNMALTSDQPILVYQTLFGSSALNTSSMNLIPPLADCIGSDSIYIFDPEQFGSTSTLSITSPITATVKIEDQAGTTLLTINPSASNFPGTLITDFKTVVYDIPNTVTGLLVSADEKVTVGFLGASSAVGGGGFMSAFSDRAVSYNPATSLFIGNGETKLDLCEENPTFLSVADNGVYTNFQWYNYGDPIPGEIDDTLSVVSPGIYYVVAEYCSLPLETPLLTVDEFGSPGGQGFSHIVGLYEAETFQGFTNNTSVGTWEDESKFFNNALSLSNAPKIKTGQTESPGFHPIAFYDEANGEYLKSLQMLYGLDGLDRYSFFVVLKDESTPNSNEVVSFGNDASSPRITKETGGYRFSQNSVSNGAILAEVATTTTEYTIVSVVSDGTNVEIFANGVKGAIVGTGSNTLDVSGELIIGGAEETASSYFDGGIAEVVIFDTAMSVADRQKTESFYAMKFGITLSPINDDTGITDGDYVSNVGTVAWDYVANSTYHNSVSAIGFDACGRLRQKQNRDANEGDFIAIGLGTIAGTNNTNTNVFANDDSFLIWGHDAGAFDSYGVTDFGPTLNPEAIEARIARVWKAQETGTVPSVRIQFNLLGGTSSAVYNLSDARLLVDTDATFATGATSYSPTSFDNTTGTVSFDHDFDPSTGFFFTLGTINNVTTPLPITLVDFQVESNKYEQVYPIWTTSSELNNDYFTLEKSQNGIDWRQVAEVPGAGNSTSLQYYNFMDKNPYSGISYYRLSQTDFDGKTVRLGTKSVALNKKPATTIKVYPNPASESFIIYASEKMNGELTVRSSVGSTVSHYVWNEAAQMTIDASNFANGVYYVECYFEDHQEVIKLIIQ